MTYSVGGLIQATDYNQFINDTNKLNTYWGQGTGDAGYGQTEVGTVAVGNTVTATQWASLLNSLNNARKHQSAADYTNLSVPVTGDRVDFISALSNTITTGYAYRLLASNPRGTTITGTNDVQNTLYAPGQSGTIYDYQEFNTNRTATITFASSDAARYFFNAGGWLSFYCQAVDNAGTNRSNALVSCIGKSTTDGLRYIQNIGYTSNSGPNFYTSRNLNLGYYDSIFGTWQQMAIYYAGSPYGTTYAQIVYDAGSSDTTRGSKGNVIRIRLNMYAPIDTGGGNINITTTLRVDILPPSTTYLSNSWGTPTITWSTV